jgi:hypothetical protein
VGVGPCAVTSLRCLPATALQVVWSVVRGTPHFWGDVGLLAFERESELMRTEGTQLGCGDCRRAIGGNPAGFG